MSRSSAAALGLALAGLLAVAAPAVAATDRYVSNAGSDNDGCTNPALPCQHIQFAINAAAPGDTIHVSAGNYAENVLVDKANLTIVGDGPTLTTITAPGANPGVELGANGDGAQLQQLGVTRGSMTGNGIYTNAAVDDVGLDQVDVTSQSMGVEIHNSAVTHGWSLSGVSTHGNSVGMRFRGQSFDTTIDDSHFDDNQFGLESVQKSSHNGTDPSAVDGLTVTGSTFDRNPQKGMYFESLSNASFDGVSVTDSGNGGASPIGVDVNLKYAAYSNIAFANSTITGATLGMAVKGRNDTADYGAQPATVTGFSAQAIDLVGNANGVDFGNNVRDVAVNGSNIDNGGYGLKDYTDPGTGPIDATCNWWGSPNGPSGAGPGTGDAIIIETPGEVVLFSPWLTAPAPSGPCQGFPPPASKDECKNGGWMNHGDDTGRPFKNQGDCVSYVATHGRNKAAG